MTSVHFLQVLHYGVFEGSNPESEMNIEKGKEVHLVVDEPRRKLNSRYKNV